MQGFLNDKQTYYFMLFTGQNHRSRMTTRLDIDGQVRDTSFYVKDVSLKVKPALENGRPRLALKMALEVDVINIEWDVDVEQEGVDEIIETALARDFQGNALEVIRLTQDWGTDIVGLGQHMRIKYPRWFKRRALAPGVQERPHHLGSQGQGTTGRHPDQAPVLKQPPVNLPIPFYRLLHRLEQGVSAWKNVSGCTEKKWPSGNAGC